jgi:hypothetical protein
LVSCQEEEWRITDECYIANNPEIYLKDYSKYNEYKVFAVRNNKTNYSIGCSWWEANDFINKYNCDNFPVNFWDNHLWMGKNDKKCSDL